MMTVLAAVKVSVVAARTDASHLCGVGRVTIDAWCSPVPNHDHRIRSIAFVQAYSW